MVEVLQGKTCQNSLPPGGGRSLGAKISGESGRPPAKKGGGRLKRQISGYISQTVHNRDIVIMEC